MALTLEGPVLELRMDRRRHVAGQGPRRRGPDHELAPAAVLQWERHVDRPVANLFVPLRELVARQHRPAAGAVRQDAMAAIEQVLLVKPLEQPPDRLD